MIIKLFKFTKRENSTKRPALTDGTDFNCVLKEQTSVVSPAVTINFGNKTSFSFDYNYAYIPEFERYYYISDMISDGYNWNVYMQSDVLATFKDAIGSTSLYVLRASAAYNGNVIDTMYPAKMNYTTNIQFQNLPWNNDPNNVGWVDISKGTFIIGAVSSSGTQGRYGSIRYYEMDATNLAALCNELLSDGISGFSANDGTLELQKAIVDPLSFIKSCVWIPREYDPAFVTTGLPIWDWIATCDYHPLQDNPPWQITSVGFDLPKHPLAATRGNYLNASPYTSLILSIPPFGMVELDTSKTAFTQRMSVVICLDLITGNAICDLTTQEGIFMGRFSSQVGVPIQLSQVSRDYVSMGTNFAHAFTDILSGIVTGAMGGTKLGVANNYISGVHSMIDGVASIIKPIQSAMGGNGGFSDLRGRATLEAIFYDPVDEDNTHLGRPLCEMRTPASLGGYILAREGDVEIEGYATEQASVKAYLEGGFYYE